MERKTPELPPSEEEKEVVMTVLREYSELIMRFSMMVGGKKDQTSKSLATAWQGLAKLLERATKDAKRFMVVKRTYQSSRPEERAAAKREEDPGTWLKVDIGETIVININVIGGIRVMSEMDKHQGLSQVAKGFGSSDLTIHALSQPTKININVNVDGLVEHDIVISLTPVVSPPGQGSVAVIKYSSASLNLINLSETFPIVDRGDEKVHKFRELNRTLFKIRH